MRWVGVAGLLENGVLFSDLLCLLFLFAVLCHAFSAVATFSLKIVGFMVDPICQNLKEKNKQANKQKPFSL